MEKPNAVLGESLGTTAPRHAVALPAEIPGPARLKGEINPYIIRNILDAVETPKVVSIKVSRVNVIQDARLASSVPNVSIYNLLFDDKVNALNAHFSGSTPGNCGRLYCTHVLFAVFLDCSLVRRLGMGCLTQSSDIYEIEWEKTENTREGGMIRVADLSQ